MARTAEFKERVQVHSSIEKQELDILEEIRWREHKDRADIIRDAIIEYLKNHKEGNDTFKLDQFQDPEFKAVPTFLSHKDRWINYYKDSNEQDRTQLRIKAIELQRLFRMVDTNP